MRPFKTTFLIAAAAACPLLAVRAQAPQTPKEKLSYAIGMDLGSSIKKQGMDIDGTFLASALKDSLSGGQLLMTNDEMIATLTAFSKEMQEKQRQKAAKAQEDSKAVAGPNKADGEKFLAANKSKPDVKTTASGLQYKVMKEGTGPSPKATDTVTVNYRGTLINGTEFDSSYKRNEPASFPVGGVIKGWTEALQLMKVGSKYQLFIPSELAYGATGAGADIGPNSTLIFEVELLAIK